MIVMNKWRNFKLKTRAAYKKIMLPFGRFIGKLGFTPNVITLISGFFGITTAVMYAFNGRVGQFQYWWLIGFVLMFFTGFLDVVDGSVARATGKTTKFGKVLDPVMDRFVEFCFLIGIAIGVYTFAPLDSYWSWISVIPVSAWCMFSFAGMLFASYSRARGESVEPINVESVGIMERREKLFILYLGNILYFWFPVALIFAIIIVGLLSFITTIQRMFFIYKELAKYDNINDDTKSTELDNIKEEKEEI